MKVEDFLDVLTGMVVVLSISYISTEIYKSLTGKDKVESNSPKFTVVTTCNGSGKIIRLNTVTGETCIVGENCDADPFSTLVVGDHYVYKGNGKFEHQKVIKYEDAIRIK